MRRARGNEARSRGGSDTALALLVAKDVPGKGRGVFAAEPIGAGAPVLEFHGEIRDISTFADLTYALQVGPREFLSASGGIDDYVNHSCAPNCGIHDVDGRIMLFAIDRIAAGEEISFDYATTQSGSFFVFPCRCGTTECRGRVGDFGDLPPARQRYYIQHGALLSYLRVADR